jgi:antirestriction protein ArdC
MNVVLVPTTRPWLIPLSSPNIFREAKSVVPVWELAAAAAVYKATTAIVMFNEEVERGFFSPSACELRKLAQ